MSCAENIIEAVKMFMENSGLSVKEMSEETNIGYQRLRNCLSGRSEFSVDEVLILADLFGTSTDKLITGIRKENRRISADLGLSDASCEYLSSINQKRKESPSEAKKQAVINLLLSGKADSLIDDLGSYLLIDFTTGYPIKGDALYWQDIEGIAFASKLDSVSVPVNMFGYAMLQSIENDLINLKGDSDNEKGKR